MRTLLYLLLFTFGVNVFGANPSFQQVTNNVPVISVTNLNLRGAINYSGSIKPLSSLGLDGVYVGTQSNLNLITGTNVVLHATNNASAGTLDVQINAAAGTGSVDTNSAIAFASNMGVDGNLNVAGTITGNGTFVADDLQITSLSASSWVWMGAQTNLTNAPFTPWQMEVTNYAYNANLVLPMQHDMRAAVTNSASGDVNLLVTNIVDGAYSRLRVTADGTPRTVSMFWPSGVTVVFMTTNATVNLTNLYVPANKTGVLGITCAGTNAVTVVTAASP